MCIILDLIIISYFALFVQNFMTTVLHKTQRVKCYKNYEITRKIAS